ncbi:MAG TPA: hypothetical protein VM891_08405 [Amaricoccus sp.]|nr:hypothetical protein [Amaricoccus sp.]
MAELAAADALAGLGLPVEAGRCRLAALPLGAIAVVTRPAEGVRLAVGQWLVEGPGEVDVSDGFAGLAVEGEDATEVLARLVPLDLAGGGLPARTLLGHTPVVISARAGGFVLLVPRSYSASAVAEIAAAMRAVAARRVVRDAGV